MGKKQQTLPLDVEIARWTRQFTGETIETHIMPLDYILDGGIRTGRIIEIFGPEQSGKTTLILNIAAVFLKRGTRVIYVDTEHVLDSRWAKFNGVDFSDPNFVLIQPDSTNQALEAIEKLSRYKEIGLFVLDSLPALALEEELEAEDYHSTQPGLLARAFNRTLRVLTSTLPKTGACFIFSNQLRSTLAPYGSPDTTPGGRMKNYAASYRIEIKRTDWIGTKQEARGIVSTIRAVKNKCGQPYRAAEIYITNKGLSVPESNFNMLLMLGIVKRSGSRYSCAALNDSNTFHTKEELLILLSENRDTIYKTFRAALEGIRDADCQQAEEENEDGEE